MATAQAQATPPGTAMLSSQPGARTGSPALATAPWMSSTPPQPSGQSVCACVCLPCLSVCVSVFWRSPPLITALWSVCLSCPACLYVWLSFGDYQCHHSPLVSLSVPVCPPCPVCLCAHLCFGDNHVSLRPSCWLVGLPAFLHASDRLRSKVQSYQLMLLPPT